MISELFQSLGIDTQIYEAAFWLVVLILSGMLLVYSWYRLLNCLLPRKHIPKPNSQFIKAETNDDSNYDENDDSSDLAYQRMICAEVPNPIDSHKKPNYYHKDKRKPNPVFIITSFSHYLSL